MLALENVVIRLDDFGLRADLAVPPQARVAVMGPSGAGKSTLLGAIGGFVLLSGGRIAFDGQDITTLHPAARPVATIFQDNNLFPHLTVARNVALGITHRRPDTATRARVADALMQVGLDGFGDRLPGSLSGGQQGRAALARALVRDKPLWLLDEPFAALGPGLRARMIALVDAVAARAGATVLMVTHDPTDAAALGGEIVVVANGMAAAPRPAARLLADPPPALAAYLRR
ncbi:ABC transporter [Oceaniovalibus guishaninsula JLT2003]|uniref:ABC transporter n=1 Tax=Oceaniovalibus guishaninsula JLT2003 TaxID=1231392 RepID=K2H9H0_9RHOB|nr:ATP-binding cassette domain-containing protein [Oceaniovalibus guishaninsula]EKE44183.1 ABC transporter [Oceaniovalibus guishaninsula JLT2003]